MAKNTGRGIRGKEIFEILDEERTEADASSAPVSDSIANVHIGETEIIIKFLRF